MNEAIQQQNKSSEYKIASVEQEGDYNFKCVAKSDDEQFSGWSKESDPLAIKVNFLEIPEIETNNVKTPAKSDKNVVKFEDSFSLICEAVASPEATYAWYKVVGEVGGPDDKSLSEFVINENEYKVNKAQWTDSGDYYCTAENGWNGGEAKKSKVVKIEVQGECDVTTIKVLEVKPADKDGKQSVTLQCQIDEEVQNE